MASFEKLIDRLQLLDENDQKMQNVKADIKSKDIIPKDLAQKLTEDDQLEKGAVRKALLEPGHETITLKPGDLVFLHTTFFNQSTTTNNPSSILASTRPEHTTHPHPIPFIYEQSICRPLRGIEIALQSMKLKERCTLHIKPSFAFQHPDCSLTPPPSFDIHKDINIDIQLVQHIPCTDRDITSCPCLFNTTTGTTNTTHNITHGSNHHHHNSNTTTTTNNNTEQQQQQQGRIIKKVLHHGTGWEVPRPPFHITATLSIRHISTDGAPQQGSLCISEQTIECDLGSGVLPIGVESALCSMKRGEEAIVWCPIYLASNNSNDSGDSTVSSGGDNTGDTISNNNNNKRGMMLIDTTSLLPSPPQQHNSISSSSMYDEWINTTMHYVEIHITLIDFLQVRDLTGDGGATKRTLKKGDGEFPSDCPMEDTTITAIIKVRQKKGYNSSSSSGGGGIVSSSQEWIPLLIKDDTTATTTMNDDNNNTNTTTTTSMIQTGCGQAPAAVEAALRLMLINETCLVTSNWKHSFLNRKDAPPHIDPGSDVEFEITLIDYVKESRWSMLTGDEKLDRAELWKNQGNMLFKSGKYDLARKKYQKSLHCVNQTMEIDTEEQYTRAKNTKVAVYLNMAACAQKEELFGESISWCNKAIEEDDENAKAHFRKGVALASLLEYNAAKEEFEAASSLDPSIKGEVAQQVHKMSVKAKAAAAAQKQQLKGFLG